MPVCAVPNCKNQSRCLFQKEDIKLYQFPQESHLQQKWLAACGRKEDTIKLRKAAICEIYFTSDSFEDKLTQPRSKNVKPRMIRRLKKGSIPTLHLILAKERRKRILSSWTLSINEDVEPRTKVLCCAGIPTYSELVSCARNNCAKACTEKFKESVDNNVRPTSVVLDNATEQEESNAEMESAKFIEISVQTDIQPSFNEKYSEVLTELSSKNEQLVQMSETNKQLINRIVELETMLQRNNKDMEEDIDRHGQKIASNILSTVFTPGQVKNLLSPTQKLIQWTAEDISSAIALRSKSGRVYKYLREVTKIPLPCESTLRNWSYNFTVKPGILHNVLEIMKKKGENLSIADKLTALSFDEVYISNKIDLERREQKIYGPHKSSQFAMARGLFGSWKQPIFYAFSQPMTKNILFEIIQALYEIGYIVVSITSDMGSTNIALWKELNVGIETSKNSISDNTIKIQHFFLHPADETLKVFMFADVPHLIKLMRNNLFDSGFNIDNLIFNKSILEELVALNEKDLKIAFNLNRDHLDAKGFQRQKVKLAAQVFSNRNATAIKYCGQQGFFKNKNWKEMGDMLELINNWFDLLNTQSKYGRHSGLRAYGVYLEHQDNTLDKMNEFILKMRVCGKKSLMPFQKGILLSNKSLKELLLYLKEKYTCENFISEYIITRRLCQDILENFFAHIRSMGGMHSNPSPVECQTRLKWYILGKHSDYGISEKKC